MAGLSRHRKSVFALVALILGLMMIAPAGAVGASNRDQAPLSGPTHNWIVGFHTNRPDAQSLIQQVVGDSSVTRVSRHTNSFAVNISPNTKPSDVVLRLLELPSAAYVEPDVEYQWLIEPNDKLYPAETWAKTDNLPDAWSIATGQSTTIVAVLDSGVRADHPDLTGKVVSGYDFFSNDTNTVDDVGHGTGVAGIIAARGNDGIGIAGAAWNVKIMPIKVGNANGAPVLDIAHGIYYAVDNGASVINLSLGSDTPSSALEDAIKYAYSHNVVVVAAAGNKPDQASFPASYPQTISVGAATNAGDSVAAFSSKISRVDLSAPGVDILTSYWQVGAGNDWALVSGTSFSTPMVTGTVALMHSIDPSLTVEQVRSILTETAKKSLQSEQGAGAGLLDAGAAVRRVLLPHFTDVWSPLDQPVETGLVHRTWNWGPNAFDVTTEPYAQAQQGERLVVYFDKSRMEISNPYGDMSSIWYVTNGLLVTEMITGRLQLGVQEFQQRQPAQIPVAGDPNDTTGPLYSTFLPLTGAAPLPEGSVVTQTLARDGTVDANPGLAAYGVTAVDLVPETQHRIASVFQDFLSGSGTIYQNGQDVNGKLYNPTFYETGYPITAPYWSRVKVAGTVKDVLIQCFERRCLTYTPSNPDGWKVEMGNVGQHYYRWRYGEPPVGPAPEDPTKLTP